MAEQRAARADLGGDRAFAAARSSRTCSVALDLMRRIKTSFDPKGILNPGKVL